MSKIKINAELVLTISASDYVQTIGKKLSNYKAVGTHDIDCSGDTQESRFSYGNEEIKYYAPKNTEVIVNYIAQSNCGTALIPKKLKSEE
jgi:hypothetical protein